MLIREIVANVFVITQQSPVWTIGSKAKCAFRTDAHKHTYTRANGRPVVVTLLKKKKRKNRREEIDFATLSIILFELTFNSHRIVRPVQSIGCFLSIERFKHLRRLTNYRYIYITLIIVHCNNKSLMHRMNTTIMYRSSEAIVWFFSFLFLDFVFVIRHSIISNN
jgi:hypothetical protein